MSDSCFFLTKLLFFNSRIQVSSQEFVREKKTVLDIYGVTRFKFELSSVFSFEEHHMAPRGHHVAQWLPKYMWIGWKDAPEKIKIKMWCPFSTKTISRFTNRFQAFSSRDFCGQIVHKLSAKVTWRQCLRAICQARNCFWWKRQAHFYFNFFRRVCSSDSYVIWKKKFFSRDHVKPRGDHVTIFFWILFTLQCLIFGILSGKYNIAMPNVAVWYRIFMWKKFASEILACLLIYWLLVTFKILSKVSGSPTSPFPSPSILWLIRWLGFDLSTSTQKRVKNPEKKDHNLKMIYIQ
jgi:hypothetical protein